MNDAPAAVGHDVDIIVREKELIATTISLDTS